MRGGTGTSTQVRLLGPVDVLVDGQPVMVCGLRRGAALATLALHSGQVVSTSQLCEAVWDGTAPAKAVRTLHSHVAHLRGILGGKAAIVARPPGYQLELPGDGTDVRTAERLFQQGTKAADPGQAVTRLRAALALWRGRPLANVTGLVWLREQAAHLDTLHEQVKRALCEARLNAGEHAGVLPGLEEMMAEHPLDEQVCALLMLALYRSGRQAEALSAYQRLRRGLAEGMGLDPGRALRDLEIAVLRQNPALRAPGSPVTLLGATPPAPARPGSGECGPAAGPALTPATPAPGPAAPIPAAPAAQAPAPAPLVPAMPNAAAPAGAGPVPAGPLAVAPFLGALMPVVPVPAQLPSAAPGFAGRAAELARLDMLAGTLRRRGGETTTAVTVAVSGAAGAGKTELAVQWAHRAAKDFPGGQLYVNLRGFDPRHAPVDPGEAAEGFLAALGVPPSGIPASTAARAGLYRSLLAGRRVLVVLDNARDAEQVRPLLPGAPGCLAIVTSRNSLASLVAMEGAHPLALGLLPAAAAQELLAHRLGRERVASEPRAVARIIERCCGVPLALAAFAARAAASPRFPLAVFAAELRDPGGVLDALGSDDPAADVRTAMSCSYRALSAEATSMFRSLGAHPGPVISQAGVPALAAVPAGRVHAALAELIGMHLLSEDAPGSFSCHGLLRAYARELAESAGSTRPVPAADPAGRTASGPPAGLAAKPAHSLTATWPGQASDLAEVMGSARPTGQAAGLVPGLNSAQAGKLAEPVG